MLVKVMYKGPTVYDPVHKGDFLRIFTDRPLPNGSHQTCTSWGWSIGLYGCCGDDMEEYDLDCANTLHIL